MNFSIFTKFGRAVVLSAVVALGALALTGCGGDDNPSGGGDDPGGSTADGGGLVCASDEVWVSDETNIIDGSNVLFVFKSNGDFKEGLFWGEGGGYDFGEDGASWSVRGNTLTIFDGIDDYEFTYSIVNNRLSLSDGFTMTLFTKRKLSDLYAVSYTVTVSNAGSGSYGGGSYAAGRTVEIYAGTPPSGQTFTNWTTTSIGVNFANANSSVTEFTMPANAVTVRANFETATASSGLVCAAGETWVKETADSYGDYPAFKLLNGGQGKIGWVFADGLVEIGTDASWSTSENNLTIVGHWILAGDMSETYTYSINDNRLTINSIRSSSEYNGTYTKRNI